MELLNGFEGHTKEPLIKVVELIDFLDKCLDTNNKDYDLDNIVTFIENTKEWLKEDMK